MFGVGGVGNFLKGFCWLIHVEFRDEFIDEFELLGIEYSVHAKLAGDGVELMICGDESWVMGMKDIVSELFSAFPWGSVTITMKQKTGDPRQ